MSEGSVFEVNQDRVDDADDQATELVEAARQRVASDNQSVKTVIKTGDPSETILAYIETYDVDHIVMGSHGEDGSELKRRLLGTVSTAVIGEASIPVTIIR
ncbi:UspA domain-containing protein [Halococcus salifodinae DSM 8989]|uniref:UspA domain-containing protein n=2 Tax=Halococcus salifodinae TaxID=36738 RepID=M0MRA9_9EURY|nr:UspA domain-containing protein [Halococcus salifodinae DSM 8989]